MQIIFRGIRKGFFTIILLFGFYLIFIYVGSIIGFLLGNPMYGCSTKNGTIPDENFTFCRDQFGSLLQSFLTMFKVATGDDWFSILTGSINYTIISYGAPILYIPFVLFSTYLIMNLVTALIINLITTINEANSSNVHVNNETEMVDQNNKLQEMIELVRITKQKIEDLELKLNKNPSFNNLKDESNDKVLLI